MTVGGVEVKVADILPWLGGVITLVVGHFLTKWRNTEQEARAAQLRAAEREEERKAAAHQRLLDDLEKQKDKTLFWRERAQSYRAEVWALRALMPHTNIPQTPDHEDEP